jgi:hypothetical protein
MGVPIREYSGGEEEQAVLDTIKGSTCVKLSRHGQIENANMAPRVFLFPEKLLSGPKLSF